MRVSTGGLAQVGFHLVLAGIGLLRPQPPPPHLFMVDRASLRSVQNWTGVVLREEFSAVQSYSWSFPVGVFSATRLHLSHPAPDQSGNGGGFPVLSLVGQRSAHPAGMVAVARNGVQFPDPSATAGTDHPPPHTSEIGLRSG